MLLGLHGFKTSGKDAFYQRAVELYNPPGFEEMTGPPGFVVERVAFADKLYESAAASIGVTVDDLLEWKNDPRMVLEIVRYETPEDAVASYRTGDQTIPREIIKQFTFREYLQWYGTEGHRLPFGDSFWVDRAFGDNFSHESKLVLVTDCRFPNEAEAVRARGGYVVKIMGPPEVENRTDMHASETPLPIDLIDYIVLNQVRDDNFKSLDAQVVKLVEYIESGGMSIPERMEQLR